mmetsp:Transcript_36765/g.36391  ORF Transcript_36765/g.36391 Transcript_36765/m.36391 type:complete len:112 (+) Transcript_36765:866-1201(+)
MGESIFSITVKESFIYVATNLYLYVLDRITYKVLTAMKLQGTPVKVKFFPVSRIEVENIRDNKDELFISKAILGFSDRHSLAWNSFYHTIAQEEAKDEQGRVTTTAIHNLK